MKKIFCLLTICCLGMFVVGACGSGPENSDSHSKKDYDMDYNKACADNDYEAAHVILNKLREKALKSGWSYGEWLNGNHMDDYRNYEMADIAIFKEEASFLMGLDDPSAENRIIKLIIETPIDGIAMSEGFIYSDEAYHIKSKNYGDAGVYARCIYRFNQKCDIAIELSILFKNKSLAKRVLALYKDNIYAHAADYDETISVKGKKVVLHETGYAWYDTTDKDAAQKKYDEAVKNGVFN